MFETGLFMGHLGRERVFILAPMQESVHLPSDLAGVTVARYDSSSERSALISATRGACFAIGNAISAFKWRTVSARELKGCYKYRCRSHNATEFTYGGACLVRWIDQLGGIKFVGRRLWNSEKTPDGKLLCRLLNPFDDWDTDWVSLIGDDLRYTYTMTINGSNVRGFGHCYVSLHDQTREIIGFSGNYFVLPPSGPEYGVEEFSRLTADVNLDGLKKQDYLWEGMEVDEKCSG
jgi:hypothetical protein